MKKQVAIAMGASLASTLCVSLAQAQTVVTQPQPAPPAQQQTVVAAPPSTQPTTVVAAPPARETVTRGGPNAFLLTSGLFTFGVPYGISVVVAAESDRDGDKNLFVPVVGPWLAYANEGECNVANVTNESCGRTTGAKVLLAGDGILQAIGAIELAAAFIVPETRTVVASKPQRRVMMAPSRVGTTGYGLAAVGTF